MKRLLQRLIMGWLKRRLPPQQRVRLGQKHIFIVPSAAGYGFALCLLLILLVAINYQNSLAYALTFLLGSVFVVTILHTWRNLGGLQLQAEAGEPVFAGDTALFGVRWLVLRKKAPGPPLLAVALVFGCYALAHFAVKGLDGTTFFLLQDLAFILLTTAALWGAAMAFLTLRKLGRQW